MGERESNPYCHKFSRSQSNKLPVDCSTSFHWETSSRQWPKVLQWLDLLLAQAVAQGCLSGSDRPGLAGNSRLIWSSRILLAKTRISKRHLRFRPIAFGNGFPEVP